jgi:formylglycine-generating enzyme required for sulfatase activity
MMLKRVLAVWMLLLGLSAGAFAAEPPGGTEIVSPVDGAIMVYVPGGEFTMGLNEAEVEQVAKDLGYTDSAKLWAWEAFPKRQLNIPGYFIDKYEVTVEQWQKYIKASGHTLKSTETSRHFDKPGLQLLPAAEIPWDEAKAYAAWAGKVLPSEEQWEKAARGTDGRLYPWGNEAPTPNRGNFQVKGKPRQLYTWVGRYPDGASPYGALDLLGNQYEWTRDINNPYPGNPQAEKMKDYGGTMIVLRGGSWYHGWVGYYSAKRFGFRADQTYYHVGFRTVFEPPAGYFESDEFTKAKEAVKERTAQIAEWTKAAEEAEKSGLIRTIW